MDSDREFLRIVIAVALTCAKPGVKKAFGNRFDEKQQDASRELSERAAEAVMQCFDVKRKPDTLGPGAHSRHPPPPGR